MLRNHPKVSNYHVIQFLAVFVVVLPFMLLASEAHANGYGEGTSILAPVISRWLHVIGGVILLGGALFFRFIVQPAAKSTLEQQTLETFNTEVTRRWKKMVHPLIAVLLVSGLYNYYLHIPAHQGDGQYHMLMGIKIILAILVFTIVSLLVSSKDRPAIKTNRATLSLISVLLGIVIVALAGYLKVR